MPCCNCAVALYSCCRRQPAFDFKNINFNYCCQVSGYSNKNWARSKIAKFDQKQGRFATCSTITAVRAMIHTNSSRRSRSCRHHTFQPVPRFFQGRAWWRPHGLFHSNLVLCNCGPRALQRLSSCLLMSKDSCTLSRAFTTARYRNVRFFFFLLMEGNTRKPHMLIIRLIILYSSIKLHMVIGRNPKRE